MHAFGVDVQELTKVSGQVGHESGPLADAGSVIQSGADLAASAAGDSNVQEGITEFGTRWTTAVRGYGVNVEALAELLSQAAAVYSGTDAAVAREAGSGT